MKTNNIKNLHLVNDILSEKDLEMMEHAGQEHLRFSNITFKVIEISDTKVVIRAVQGRSSSGIYFDAKRLIEIVHETFDRFFTGRKVQVNPVPYEKSPAGDIDAAWINKKMETTGIRLKEIAADTGLNYTRLSVLINGERPLSQVSKALFWFYFKAKEAE